MRTHDCEPTLTDRQVIQFCREGFLKLEGVVSGEVTDRALEFCREYPDNHETTLLEEDWFVAGLLLNPEAAGAVRSLLGANFGLPPFVANHVGVCPDPDPLGWHVDGGNMHTFALNYLQVFCLPQDTTVEMGPTEILPGSHFLLGQSALVSRYGAIRGTHMCDGPAGTVYITCYPIWHRRYRATATDVTRYLFKYNYYRTSAPQRDWIVEDDFDPGRHTDDFSHLKAGGMYMRRNFLDSYDAAHMYMWLCGHEDEFRYVGGTAWPAPAPGDTWPAHIDNYAVPPSLSTNGKAYQPEAPPMLRHS